VLGFGAVTTTFNFEASLPDTTCPIISNIQIPALVAVNTGVYLTANIDDSTTGGSSIASSSYSVNGGLPVAMVAADGGFDEVSEDVTAFISFPSAGIYTMAVKGTDSAGNSCAEQIMIVVYDPSGGFVTGGGWIDSPTGAVTGPDALQVKWYQPFDGDTAGWLGSITPTVGGTALVAGSAYSYFDIALPPADDRTLWPGTWFAEIDVYLDPSWATGKGFDYSVASSKSDGGHLRDFIFHVGVVENCGPVAGKALVVNGSNNTDSTVNPFKLVNENGGNYHVITTAGWYRLQHRFRDAGGYLAVDLNLLDSLGAVVWTATRSNVADTLPGIVGNGRYGWFIFAAGTGGIEVDNHRRLVFGPTYPTGRANFGFVSKYKKGANVPEGSTEFVFQAGGLNFHSSAYEWLVVNQNGTNAQFKGTGRINGAGNYGFMIWANDNGNGGATDTFRIQIVDKDNGDATVYDNGVQQTLGGGNILIQTKK
jgi:hypothetical protein